MKKVILDFRFAAGDCLVLTNVLRDLQLNYPDEFQVEVMSYYPEIFYGNPNFTKFEDTDQIQCYKKIEQSEATLTRNNFLHCSSIFNMIISDFLFDDAYSIPQQSIYPELYLTDLEKSEKIIDKFGIEKPFWIVNSSFKQDMPLKSWIPYKWQELIYQLSKRNVNVVQTGSHYDLFEELKYCKSVIGKTENIRDFISLCYHCEGIITHVSFPVHVAAALDKPCVVICGGREHPWYSCYPNQQVIHTINSISNCFLSNGCFKKERSECINMVGSPAYPLCMSMISINEVLLNVMKYIS